MVEVEDDKEISTCIMNNIRREIVQKKTSWWDVAALSMVKMVPKSMRDQKAEEELML